MYKLISKKIECTNNSGLIIYITKKFRENIIKNIEDKCDYITICQKILDEFEKYLENNSKEKILLEIEEFQEIYNSEKNVKPQLLSINDINIK